MEDALVSFLEALGTVPWLEIIKTAASAAVAFIAFFALRNWQRQDKAKREAEFLDAIVDATNACIVEMSGPIEVVKHMKIGMDSHVPTWEQGDETAKAVKGAIDYIQKRGAEDSKRLREELSAARPSTIRLSSLAVKGQVFSFSGYAKCQKAVEALIAQFEVMQRFSMIVGWPSLNWENPDVLASLKGVMATDPGEMNKALQDNNVAVIEFARETYKRIYSTLRIRADRSH